LKFIPLSILSKVSFFLSFCGLQLLTTTTTTTTILLLKPAAAEDAAVKVLVKHYLK
jgi:hypothetical protein